MAFNLAGVVSKHKQIGRSLIYASDVEATIYVEPETPIISSGAPMFGTTGVVKTYEAKGPFKCIWINAARARTKMSDGNASIIGRFEDADAVAKFWAEDLLVSGTNTYDEKYLDRSSHVVSYGKRYEILGYDLFGLGLTPPYMLAVALKGSYTSNG